MTPLIQLVSLVTLPIALLIALAHLLGAEGGPGDGFTAGIITSLALTLEYLAFGYQEARGRIRWIRFDYVLFSGIAVALLAALLPLFAGDPLLGTLKTTIRIPGLDTIELSRSLLFELGIFLVVVGGSMTVLDNLREEESA